MVRVGATLIVLFVLVYAGVSIWYGRLEETLLKKPVATEKTTAAAPVEKTEIVRQSDDFSIIVQRNIFQAAVTKAKEQEKVVKEDTAPAPTKLKLSLMGTISGNDQDARAIISDDMKRQQDIYQVGDSIQGAIIKEIDRGRVVLAVNNRDEVLTLKDREGGGAAYQPSPSDYYKEPAEPQTEQVEGNTGEATVNRQPIVRPRPVRRRPNLRQRQTTETENK